MSKRLELSHLLEDIRKQLKEVQSEIEKLEEGDIEFFEKIRKTTNFKDLNSMFKRWQELVNFNTGGKR